jgi:phage-related protein/predicted XRE-type DNA-binding protein
MIVPVRAKELVWIASSRRNMRALPKKVRRIFGLALFAVRIGETPPIAKSLKGFGGSGVLELIENDQGGTYRAIYTVRYATAVYVLHVFQKKSKRGKATPPQDIELVASRLKRSEEMHFSGDEGRPAMKRDHEKSSGDVFADLGFRNPKQELLKPKLTIELYRLLNAPAITHHEAARLLGTTQPQVSALMRCKPASVSVGRLMEFLTILGRDVQVTVRPASRRRKAGDMSVVVQPR